jgi:hypothetical protein
MNGHKGEIATLISKSDNTTEMDQNRIPHVHNPNIKAPHSQLKCSEVSTDVRRGQGMDEKVVNWCPVMDLSNLEPESGIVEHTQLG